MRYNDFCMEYAIGHEWLDDYRIQITQGVIKEDPSVDVLEYLRAQGWLWPEQYEEILERYREYRKTAPEEDEKAAAASKPAADAAPNVQVADDGALKSVQEYLKLGRERKASDIHLAVAAPPTMRLQGVLKPLWPGAEALSAAQTSRLLLQIMSVPQRERLEQQGHVDFAYELPDLGRFRANILRDRLGVCGVFHIVDREIRSLEELGLPGHCRKLLQYQNGLVLVTGPAGCGKTTTLAAMVEELNVTRRDHILTLEDPIEFAYEPKGCHVSQRAVGVHTQSFADGLKAALREDPDIIVIGELRDLESVSLAVTAAETGHLVIGTLHTGNAARTVNRILDIFPPDQHSQICTTLAGSLRGIVCQRLVPRADGAGRVLAYEMLVNMNSTATMIRQGDTFKLAGAMQTGRQAGCRLLDDCLKELVLAKTISIDEAMAIADDKMSLKAALGVKDGKASDGN